MDFTFPVILVAAFVGLYVYGRKRAKAASAAPAATLPMRAVDNPPGDTAHPRK